MVNLTYFEIRAKYTPTNRFRKTTILARSEEEAIEKLKAYGYTEIESITPYPEDPPSQRQIAYATSLGIQIEPGYCKKDVSALIDRKLTPQSDPNPGLVDYASEHQFIFSKFIGKKSLYDLVFFRLTPEEKIAFFIFSVYRFLSNNREANLNKSPYRDLFLQKSAEWSAQDNMFKSLINNYTGPDLRFFGTLVLTNGQQAQGGSTSTLIYRETVKFLKSQGLITDTKKGPQALQAKIQVATPQPAPQPAPVAPHAEAIPTEDPPESQAKKSPMKAILILVGIAIILFLLF